MTRGFREMLPTGALQGRGRRRKGVISLCTRAVLDAWARDR